MFNPSFLFASLLWSSIGVGYLVYGRRQKEWVPTLGGIVMIVASYFAPSGFSMSIICVAVGIGVYVLVRQGY
jgi:hypothetical protein